MINLKPYMKAVNATEMEVERIAQEIDKLFQQETEEGNNKALELKAALDEAIKKKNEAMILCEAMRKVNKLDENPQLVVIKRQTYNQISLEDQAKFITSGGIVEE